MFKRTFFIVFLAFLAVSCAVNPVTGKKELSLISEAQEIELGKQTDKEVAAQFGLYDDLALKAYVSKLGLAMAAKTQRPRLPYRFAVLDSPVVNAFAVPGGSIYVTRGILALMGSEAELAAILGHELGHVNARHSVTRMSQQILAQIGLIAGSLISKEFAKYAGLAGIGVQVLFLKYSRDDERQADALGVDYSRLSGYDPADMALTFASLQKLGDLSGGRSLPGFLSTHPLSSERVKNVQGMLKPEDGTLARKPEAYLRTIENMTYGDDPRQGYVEGSAFYHPELRFMFAIPSGWKVDNTPGRVTLVSKDQNGGIILQGAPSSDSPEDYGRKQAEEITRSGGSLLGEDRMKVNGLTCFEQAFTIPQQNQASVRMRRSYVKKGGWIYAFSAMSSEQGFQGYDPDFRRVVSSFRELTNPAFINRSPRRLGLVKADGVDTLQAIFRKAGMPETATAHFAILNGLDANAIPAEGKLIKVIR